MKLGLDLRGGVHFLMEVDMDKALDARRKVYEGEVKSLLRKERVRYRSLPELDGAIQLGFADEAALEKAQQLIRKDFTDFDLTTVQRGEQQVLRLKVLENRTDAEIAAETGLSPGSIRQYLHRARGRLREKLF